MDTSDSQPQLKYSIGAKILLYLSGADKDVVDSQVFSENDEEKLKTAGKAILVGTVVALVNAWFLGKMICDGNGASIWYAVMFALFWGGMVYNSDQALFRMIEMNQLWWRIAFLIISGLGVSVGFQLWRANTQIVDKINLEAGNQNDVLLREIETIQEKYDPRIEELQRQVSAIWRDPNEKFKTKAARHLEVQIKELKATRDSNIKEKKRINTLRQQKPDYSFNNKFDIFRENFAFRNIFDFIISLIFLLFEGWALWVRFINSGNDYFKYLEVKKNLPKRVVANMTIDQKVQLYIECQKHNQERKKTPPVSPNPKPDRGSDNNFKSFDINDIEIP